MLAVMVAEVAAALGNISPLGVETAGWASAINHMVSPNLLYRSPPSEKKKFDQQEHV